MSEIIEDRCIVCDREEIYGNYPVCKSCQDKQENIRMQVTDEIKGNKRTDLHTISQELGISRLAVSWYVKTDILSDKHKAKLEKMAQDNLIVKERIFGDNLWLEVGGKIDSINAENLKEHIDGLISDGWLNIILDMKEIAFFSSTGIRVVLATYKKLTSEGGSFFIENPGQNVKNVLGMVALNKLLLR